MFGFKKKPKEEKLELPPFPAPSPKKDEIELIPEELPSLESAEPVKVSMPSAKAAEEMPEQMQEKPMQMPVPAKTAKKMEEMPSSDIFIRTENHQKIMSDISEIGMKFTDMDEEISKVNDIKDMRYDKMDSLQQVLEDTAKKLLYIDSALFGGTK